MGLSPEHYEDPWKRPYKIHVLQGRILVVQSTGKSGVDRLLSPTWLVQINSHLQPTVQFVGDNLIIVKKGS